MTSELACYLYGKVTQLSLRPHRANVWQFFFTY